MSASQPLSDVSVFPTHWPLRRGHRDLRTGEWWRRLPAWKDVDAATFNDHRWQTRNSVRSGEELMRLLPDSVEPDLVEDLRAGLAAATMVIRVTPYLLSLVDWTDVRNDPIRRQFLPLGSEHEPDHPMVSLDALGEQDDTVAPGLVHRYPDKVLFLALDVCPVYCRYCTRSYSAGADTGTVEKQDFRPARSRWEQAFAYLRRARQVEDVVVSGGDLSMLGASALLHIGRELLAIPHIRRIRLATKVLSVMPQKILSDTAWTDALLTVADEGRQLGVHVCVHTHFAHPAEITDISRQACDLLFQAGVTIRNQCVLLRGVNDDVETMLCLVRRLALLNVQPYYVYIHDLVPGVEVLRTDLATGIEIEKRLRGRTAGFMTPTFVCDTMGGGGKRDVHSHEVYDQERGVAVFRSPGVDPRKQFFHLDPLRYLSPEMQRAWQDPETAQRMLREAGQDAEP